MTIYFYPYKKGGTSWHLYIKGNNFVFNRLLVVLSQNNTIGCVFRLNYSCEPQDLVDVGRFIETFDAMASVVGHSGWIFERQLCSDHIERQLTSD